MDNPTPEPKKGPTWRGRIVAATGSIGAVAVLAFKKSIETHLEPPMNAAIDWIIKNGGPNLRPFLQFFGSPATVPSGLLLCVLLALASFAVVVILANAWIALRGPKVADYSADTFIDLRWSWGWGKPEKGSRFGEIERLTPHCPICGSPMTCRKPPYSPGLDDYGSSVEGRNGFSHPKNPEMICAPCRKTTPVDLFKDVKPCEFLMESIKSQIIQKVNESRWIEPAKAELAKRRKVTLYLPAIVDRWFSRR
jgi:hypothetical protein